MELKPAHYEPTAWFDACVQRAAAHLALLGPTDAFLRGAAGAYAPNEDGTPDDPERLAQLGEQLAAALGTVNHPLATLSQAYRLSPFETDLLVFALLPELDDRFADALHAIQAGRRRPTLALAVRALLSADTRRDVVRAHLTNSALWRAGLLARDQNRDPFFDRVLEPVPAVSAGVVGVLPDRFSTGAEPSMLGLAADTDLSRRLQLRPSAARVGKELADWSKAAGPGIVHLQGGDPVIGALLAEALAASMERPLLRIRPASQADLLEATAASWLHGALLLLELHPDTKLVEVPEALAPPLPIVVLAPPACEIRLPPHMPARRIQPPGTRPIEQAATWERLLGEAGATARTDLLANRTRLSVSEIERTSRLATLRAKLRGAESAEQEDVVLALSEVKPEPSSALGRTWRPTIPWDRLVLDEWSMAHLDDLVLRIEHRVTVQDRWGMGKLGDRGRGLAALLHGESGTGKTLAAEAIASRLGLPLLAVDLSRVVSKYIGETEKHLSSLFDLTEGYGAVLFFDESDALFGKRTGVRDAHDRYANIEINYLLQRLETYEGVTLLATNLLQNLDEAFTRRLQFSIPFPRPSREHQVQIWRRHLPAERLAPDVDLHRVVRAHQLVGGDIRNAALSAAYAAAAGAGVITQDHLIEAARRELIKKGSSS